MGGRTYTVRGLHGTGITRKGERGYTRGGDTRGVGKYMQWGHTRKNDYTDRKEGT